MATVTHIIDKQYPVYATGNQVISGFKTFTSRPTLNGAGFLLSGEAAVLPSTIVYTTGDQIISGAKTFNNNIVVSTISGISGATQYSLSLKALDNTFRPSPFLRGGGGIALVGGSGFDFGGSVNLQGGSSDQGLYNGNVNIDSQQISINSLNNKYSSISIYKTGSTSPSPNVYITQDYIDVSNNLRVSGVSVTPEIYVNRVDNQSISGLKAFTTRPTVNGSGVLLIGEAPSLTLPGTIVYTTGNQSISGIKIFEDYLNINTSNVTNFRLSVAGDKDENAGMQIDSYGINPPQILMRRARGDVTTLSGVLKDDVLFNLQARGYVSGLNAYSTSSRAAIRLFAAEDWLAKSGYTGQGTYIAFRSTNIGKEAAVEKVSINSSGLNVLDGNIYVSGNSVVDTASNQAISGIKNFNDGLSISNNPLFYSQPSGALPIYIEDQEPTYYGGDGGYFFGRTKLSQKTSRLVDSSFGSAWVVKETSRSWTDISISSDGKYQSAVASSGQIYVSSDYGNTWVAKESSRFWTSISISSDGKYQAAGVFAGFIYISSDYGRTWLEAGNTFGGWNGGISISSDGKYQVASQSGVGIFGSNDYGKTWVRKFSAVMAFAGVSISSDGKYQSAIVQNGQIYISSDYGATWTTKDSNRSWSGISMSSDGKYQTAVVSGGQIYISTDYGATWTAKDSDRFWGTINISSDGKYQTSTIGNQVYVSINYGNTWTLKVYLGGGNITAVSISSDGKYQSLIAYNGQIFISKTDELVDGNFYANNLVYNTGDQTIAGNKTFSSPVYFSYGGNINLLGGDDGVGGSVNLSNNGGSINLYGGNNDGDGRVGGSIDLHSFGGADEGGNGGSIIAIGAQQGSAGSLNMSSLGDSNGGSITTQGGAGEGCGGGSIDTRGANGFETPGGSILTYAGSYGGGSINLSNNNSANFAIQTGDLPTQNDGSIYNKINDSLYIRKNSTWEKVITDKQSIVYRSGNQVISGFKTFTSRPTVNGSGVLLVGDNLGSLPSSSDTINVITGNFRQLNTNNLVVSGTATFNNIDLSEIDNVYVSGADVVIDYSGNDFFKITPTGILSNLPIVFGDNNVNSGDRSNSIFGGSLNTIARTNSDSFITNATSNNITSNSGSWNSINGGRNNSILSGSNNYILGGLANQIEGENSFIMGGEFNFASGSFQKLFTYGGTAVGSYSSLIGGTFNTIHGGQQNLILGGNYNNIFASATTGINTIINSWRSTIQESSKTNLIINGAYNSTSGDYNSIINGYYNENHGRYNNVLNGSNNRVSGAYSTVINGKNNFLNGSSSTVLHGSDNNIFEDGSAVIGNKNYIDHSGAVLISDSTSRAKYSKNTNSLSIDFANGVYLENEVSIYDLRLRNKKYTDYSYKSSDFIFSTYMNIVNSASPVNAILTFVEDTRNFFVKNINSGVLNITSSYLIDGQPSITLYKNESAEFMGIMRNNYTGWIIIGGNQGIN